MATRKNTKSTSKKAKPGKKKQEPKVQKKPPVGKPPTTGKPKPKTTERPKPPPPPKCDCTTSSDIYTQIGSLRPVAGRALRIHVNIRSVVVCDEATPDHCYYRYIATADIQRYRPRRGRRPAAWEAYARRNAFIQSFTVHDNVNKTEHPDRIDQSTLELGEWFPLAPQKESTRITLELVGSARGGWRTTINRNLELCVPKLDNPDCPEVK